MMPTVTAERARNSGRPHGRSYRVRWLLGFWLFVLSGVAFLDRTNISIAGLDMMREFGWNNQRLGFVFSAFLIGYAGCQLPAGLLAARFGPRKALSIGVIWWGVATLATATLRPANAHALALLLACRLALGAGEAVIYPAANQFVANWFPKGERGLINGLIFAGVGMGSGLTPPLLTWIIAEHGWRAAFGFSAAVGFVAGSVWWLFSRDRPDEYPILRHHEGNEVRENRDPVVARSTEADKKRSPPTDWAAMVGRADLPALVLSYFSFGYVAWVFFSWFFLYLAQVRGLDLKASGRLSMLPFLCMTMGSLGGGLLSDRLTRIWGLRAGRCYLAAVSLLVAAGFLVLGSQVRSATLAAVVLAGGAGALYISQSTFWAASVDLAGRRSAVFSSIVNMGGQIGGALTASLTPYIAHRAGWGWSFGVAAGFAVIGSMSWLLIHPEIPIQV